MSEKTADIIYLEKILEALKTEREEDFLQFKEMIQSVPLAERIELGYSWYPIKVEKAGYAIGDRAFVIVERQAKRDTPHQFRDGGTVSFFIQRPDGKIKEKTGVINFIERNRMKIILNAKDIPEWIDEAGIGLDMLFDERSYQEMEKVLHKVIKADKIRLAEMRAIIHGIKPAHFSDYRIPINIAQLNVAQNEAIAEILAAHDVAIIHGPPGTGKTTTLVQAIKELNAREGAVLVCAPSNSAVDLLTDRLSAAGLNVVRVGNISRVDEDLLRHTVDYIMAHHPERKNINKIRAQASDSRRKAKRYRRSFGVRERESREKLQQEANELSAWANQLENRLLDQILDGADVIACTLVGAAHPTIDKYKFRTVVVDEAAQALEPAIWIPLCKADKIVFAGDPFQLPPTVKSVDARKMGLAITTMERCLSHLPNALLNVQYRMNQAIMDFSNDRFYEGKLQAHESVKDHQLIIDDGDSVTFIDTVGCGFDEQVVEVQGRFPSRFNPDEFVILREHMLQVFAEYAVEDMPSVAIISPYKEQVIYMQTMIRDDEKMKGMPITVNTIDGFQGQERDVVYISLVRSNSKGEIGFLTDYRRMNVAMTRARKKLTVIGDSGTIGQDKFYDAFLNYCEKRGAYHTAWEFML
ncbi:MAG: AAA domain-containing protein [Saprospiraceae bacterium]